MTLFELAVKRAGFDIFLTVEVVHLGRSLTREELHTFARALSAVIEASKGGKDDCDEMMGLPMVEG